MSFECEGAIFVHHPEVTGIGVVAQGVEEILDECAVVQGLQHEPGGETFVANDGEGTGGGGECFWGDVHDEDGAGTGNRVVGIERGGMIPCDLAWTDGNDYAFLEGDRERMDGEGGVCIDKPSLAGGWGKNGGCGGSDKVLVNLPGNVRFVKKDDVCPGVESVIDGGR